jgi:DNA-binding transcriptional LysR family regulator
MEVRLETLDLNLLVVFEALMIERNVTRAASRLRRSQPALSRALTHLRHELGDPLFIRGRHGITPTARALDLAGPVQAALASLRQALEPGPTFDPNTARHTFVVAASDHAQLLVLPKLVGRLAAWPGLTLRVVALPTVFPTEALERGELDVVVGLFNVAPGDDAPASLKRQVLFDEHLCVVGRSGHPALRRPVLARLAQLPQVNVSPRGGTRGRFERSTAAGALERNIVLYVPHYAAVPWLLMQSDLLAVLPEQVAKLFARQFPLRCVELDVGRRLKVQQLWHPRSQLLPANRWLRAQLLELAKA